MKIWTVANQKGGVGKTTTAVTLGGLLTQQGYRVLLMDLDPHGSLTSYFGFDPDSIEESVYSLFQKAISNSHVPLATILRHTGIKHLDLLPACTSMVSLDRQIGQHNGMGLVIKKALGTYDHHYDYVLIDCPPVLGILMVNALACCERLLIPVQTEFLAIKGLDRILNTLKMIILSGKNKIDYLIVPTFFDRRTRASRDSLHHLQQHYHDHLWNGHIPVDTKFREASSRGKPISCLYSETRGIQAYRILLQFLLQEQQAVSDLLENVG